ncbi:hypothetical protein UlMin_024836 [Ulmus minor]
MFLTRTTTTRGEPPSKKLQNKFTSFFKEENFNELKEDISRQIVQAQADIEDLKKQLEESMIERQHKEECCLMEEMRLTNEEHRTELEDAIGDADAMAVDLCLLSCCVVR